MIKVNYNERSWAIDLITEINLWASNKDVLIKRAGGENTIKEEKKILFPDVLLFGDEQKGRIIQGWELKMPDTDINDTEFIYNAKKKAKLLSLNSFLLWNVKVAVLYKINEDDSLSKIKTWNTLSHIENREEVEKNSSLIKTELHRILADLNMFIQTGEIKSTSVIDVLSGEQISEFINKNLGSYIDNLKLQATRNGTIEAEINLWWRYAKNDHPEENDKYIVLAKINLIYLINKFLFAHILKSYQKEASCVNQINENTSLTDGLEIFQEISQKVDFWNVFQTQPTEQYISSEVWSDLISFNNFLKSFNFENIEKNLLHDLIGHTVYHNKRKFAGQFTTPFELAKLAVLLTLENKNGTAIDPCCGTGTIAREIFLQKKASIGLNKALESTWASDKFALPLQMAMFNMIDPEAMGKVLQVFKQDATNLQAGKDIELRDPFNGDIVNKTTPKFEYIISNLPFVQQEDLKVLNPNIQEINSFIEEMLGKNTALDGRSDLYAYLPFYFWNALQTNGRLTIIISNSWLGASFGIAFYNAISAFYHIEAVITSGKGRWFDNAKVVTNIVILKKKEIPIVSESELTKFVVIKQPLTQFNEEQMKELVALIKLTPRTNESDILINSYSRLEINSLKTFGLNLNSLFIDNRWITALEPFLVKVSSLFDIGRGERRGWDSLFYPDNSNNIEQEFLKPVLKTPRSIDNLIAEPDALAFCCTKTIEELNIDGNKGAIEWIKRFEGQTNNTGKPLPDVLQRAGINWYTMESDTMGEIVASINFGDRLFFAKFSEPTFVNQRLIRFTRKDTSTDLDLCHALLNSTLGMFFIEALGTGRGEGVLDLTKDKIEDDLLIINPSLFNNSTKIKILDKFKKLKQRGIYNVETELAQQDRDELDTVILEALGVLELKKHIKSALLDLYSIRISVKS